MWNNWKGASYDRAVQTNMNEELYHRGHPNATLVTSLALSVVGYLEQYPICFDVGGLPQMQNDVNALQGWDGQGERHDTAVPGWAEHWNHCGGCSVLSCNCFGKETELSFFTLSRRSELKTPNSRTAGLDDRSEGLSRRLAEL